MHETFKQTIFFVADTKLTLVCKSLTFVTAHEQQQNQKRNKDSHTSATWTRYFSSYYLVHSCVTLRFWLMHNVQQTETWIYQRRAIRCVYFSSFISISILSPNRHTRHGIRTFVRCWSLWLNKKNLQLDEITNMRNNEYSRINITSLYLIISGKHFTANANEFVSMLYLLMKCFSISNGTVISSLNCVSKTFTIFRN